MDYLGLALLAYVALSLALPYVLAGDRSLATFAVYVLLSAVAIGTATIKLRRWSRVE
ncbi:MAG: hypothetical protein RMH84_01005 [Sulfolobales archaeon]|nr:hypothetical protein [Sulfolobales archaeon]MCX8208564.1 hypothetical protein [Sulfolobales archaeon]MDW8010164.1 hypothetical protein [Sulfolobales archaeon]